MPSTSTRSPSFPETVHLLYSPTSSAILSISPTAPFLSVSDTPNAPPPPSISAVAGSGDGTGGAGVHESGSGLTGMGVGALTGLGGYVGLGSKAAAPVGCSIIDGEVLLGRDGALSSRQSDRAWLMSQIWELSYPPTPATPARTRCNGLPLQTRSVSGTWTLGRLSSRAQLFRIPTSTPYFLLPPAHLHRLRRHCHACQSTSVPPFSRAGRSRSHHPRLAH